MTMSPRTGTKCWPTSYINPLFNTRNMSCFTYIQKWGCEWNNKTTVCSNSHAPLLWQTYSPVVRALRDDFSTTEPSPGEPAISLLTSAEEILQLLFGEWWHTWRKEVGRRGRPWIICHGGSEEQPFILHQSIFCSI